ncbi:GIN domain-containing protein [Flavobacterium sp. WC2509]|uniref:GIN domain-containing protein n=1 Tax=Flavobacterium sp. WC2509 TaxID=3461406 RepID=UPI004044629B
MKYSHLVIFFFLATTLSIGQNKEKIKGSKVVVEKLIETEAFTALEIEDNLTVFLEKGDKNEIKIESDDNLQDVISFDIKEKTLRIYTSKEISSFKKLAIKIKYTNDLKSVTAKNIAIINALEAVQLDDITFKSLDYAKLYLNVNSKSFNLFSDDKTKVELNLKAEKSKIQLSKNAQIKALITTTDLSFDMYQKATATIEGESTNATLRLDNDSAFTGSRFTIHNADVTTENATVCNLMADTTLIIDANNTSKIYLLGAPKIEVRKFLGEAQLIKKAKL